jgi:hypothetical protein
MSLLITIQNISNQFITVYAILDSWCDRVHDGQMDRGQLGVGHHQVRNYFMTVEESIAAINNIFGNIGAGKSFNPTDLHTEMPFVFREDGSQEFNEVNLQDLRRKLRDQLFAVLCLLDGAVAIHRNPTTLLLFEPVNILKNLAEQGLQAVSKLRQYPEYSSGPNK